MEKEILMELLTRGSFEPFANCVSGKDKLSKSQQMCVYFSLLNKKTLINLPTGRGKTYIMSAMINIMGDTRKSGFSVVVIKSTNEAQVVADIRRLTGKKVLSLTGDTKKVNEALLGARDTEILVLTYEAVLNTIVNELLFNLKDNINLLIVDESLGLGTPESLITQMVSVIAPYIKYIQFLTATPLRVEPEQFISQLSILNERIQPEILNKYKDFDYTTNELKGYKNLDKLYLEIWDTYFFRTNKDMGIEDDIVVKVHTVMPIEEQLGLQYFKIRTLPGATNHREDLKRYISSQKGKKGIIYAHRNELKEQVIRDLHEIGVRFTIIDGTYMKKAGLHTQEEQALFSAGEYDVVITNVTSGLNLQADYIYFYELTVDMIQMLGRASRGLEGSKTEVILPLILDTDEIRFFVENIYDRSKLLRDACKSETRVIENINRIVGGM